MPLSKGDKGNFETLKLAVRHDDVALMDVRRRADGKSVAAVCAVNAQDGKYEMIPLAVMVEGNPFELFDPPVPGSGSYQEPDEPDKPADRVKGREESANKSVDELLEDAERMRTRMEKRIYFDIGQLAETIGADVLRVTPYDITIRIGDRLFSPCEVDGLVEQRSGTCGEDEQAAREPEGAFKDECTLIVTLERFYCEYVHSGGFTGRWEKGKGWQGGDA